MTIKRMLIAVAVSALSLTAKAGNEQTTPKESGIIYKI
jgi:hypothetical protein